MINLNELQFFAQVGKTQSFTLAARQLSTPKSAVSRAVASLEKRLGVRLVERTTRRVALTEAGELFLERCLRVLEEAEHADSVINSLHSRPKGRLRIGAPTAYVRFVLAPIIPDFLREFPEIKLSVQIIQNSHAANESALDIAIRQGPLNDSVMRVMPLKKTSLGLYASAGYVSAHGAPMTPAELRGHRLIVANCGANGEPADFAKFTLSNGTQTETVRVESHVSLADPTVNLQLTLADAGIAPLSQALGRTAVAKGELVRVLPQWETEAVQLHAVYASRLNSSPKVRAFLEFLKARTQTT